MPPLLRALLEANANVFSGKRKYIILLYDIVEFRFRLIVISSSYGSINSGNTSCSATYTANEDYERTKSISPSKS